MAISSYRLAVEYNFLPKRSSFLASLFLGVALDYLSSVPFVGGRNHQRLRWRVGIQILEALGQDIVHFSTLFDVGAERTPFATVL